MFDRAAVFLLTLFLVSCYQQDHRSSHIHYFVGSNWLMKSPHHEELVRLASLRLNDYAGQDILPIDDFGVRGKDSYNPIVRGNYLTDIPEDTRPGEYDLAEYYGLENIDDIFWDKSLQSIHFIRDQINGRYLDTQTNCERAVEGLKKDAKHILKNWHSDQDYALNLMGHLSHSIQDSTSHGHIRRTEILNLGKKRISDICSFFPTKGHCNHISDLEADNIWKDLLKAIKGTVASDESYEDLKESAQLGVDLTFEAWRVIYEAVKSGPLSEEGIQLVLDNEFQAFLKNPYKPYSGYYLCPNDVL